MSRCRPRDERGATTAEYVGVIVVVAVLVAAIALTPIGAQVSGGLRAAICSILGLSLGDCGDGRVTAGDPAAGDAAADGSSGNDLGRGGGDSDDLPIESSCSGFWCTVGNVAQGVGSGVVNFGGAIWDDVTGLVDLVTDPSLLIDAGQAIWDDPLGVAGQLVWDGESRELWGNGDYGGAIGRTTWNVGSFVIGVTKIAKGGRLGAAAGGLDDVADVAVDARRAADAAADAARAGDVATAVERAAQARRIADDAAERARSLGCPLAAPPPRRLDLDGAGGGGGRGPMAAGAVRMLPLPAAGPCDDAADAADAARDADRAADEAELAARAAAGIDLDAAAFAQNTYGEVFSDGGRFAGQRIDDVADGLRSGALSPADVPIDVIVRDGNTLILNTRSSQALTRAGIPRSDWAIVNRTGDGFYEGLLDGQLRRNRLDSTGTQAPRSTG